MLRKLFGRFAAILIFCISIVGFTAMANAGANTGQMTAGCKDGTVFISAAMVHFPADRAIPVRLQATVNGNIKVDTTTDITVSGTVLAQNSKWAIGHVTVTNPIVTWHLNPKGPLHKITHDDFAFDCAPPVQKTLKGSTSATSVCVGKQRTITVSIFNTGTDDFRITAWNIPFTDAPIGPFFQVVHGNSLPFRVAGHTSGIYGDKTYQVTVVSMSNGKQLKLNGTISGQVPQCPKPTPVIDRGSVGPPAVTTQPTTPATQLPFTGGDVIWLSLIGIGAVSGGTALIRSGRRHNPSEGELVFNR